MPVAVFYSKCICFFLALLCSSNGKSVTWAQTERNSKGGHLWQRLSFHIKKRENNQTAVIKPFSKAAEDVTPESATDKMLYEVAESEERYVMCDTYRPRTPSPISTVSQRTGEIPGRSQGPDDEQIISVSSYVSQSSRRESGSCAGGGIGSGGGVAVSGAVGIVGGVSSSSQGSLMEQISCVVNRFTANISELNSMMLSTSPPRPSKVPPPYFLSRDMSMPATMTTYAEIQPLPPVESNGARPSAPSPLGGPPAITETTVHESQPPKGEMEEILALTPPSPFRDSVASESVSNSPASGSSPKYECLVLRHYSQSSSSL